MCDLNQCGENLDLPPIQVNSDARRLFLKGAASLPLATVLAYPELAAAQADQADTVRLSVGGSDVSAALAKPATDKAPAVLLIHEWWGLNDQIKSVAVELSKLGYLALAVDLYGGTVATDRDGAMAAMKAVDKTQASQTLGGWIDWLKNHENGNGKVATMGWCFGGGWSLNASVANPVDATIIYYGRVTQPAEQLAKLNGPVLGHFGKQDKSINEEMVAGFEAELGKAGKTDQTTIHWYDANHAFANPTGARYDAGSAKLSWERTLAFLQANIG